MLRIQTYRMLIGVLLAFCTLPLLGQPSKFDSMVRQQKAIDRLVTARKFEAAEFLCREQLSDSSLPLEERSAFTVELIRVLVSRGREVTAEERETVFKQAVREVEQYLSRDKDSLQRYLVLFQDALIPRTLATLRRFELVRTSGSPADQEVLRLLRQTRKKLESLAEDLDAELHRFRRRDPGESGYLTAREMRQLRARVGLELGRTFAEQGSAYPAGSDDRILSGSQGAIELQRLSPTSLSPTLWLASRFSLLRCLRWKGDWPAIAKQLRTLRGTRLSRQAEMELQAELIRIAIARKDWPRLTELVAGAGKSGEGAAASKYDTALVEGYLSLARRSRDGENNQSAVDWEERATQIVEQKKKLHSALWLRHVQALLASETVQVVAGSDDSRTNRISGSGRLQLHAAQGLIRKGEWQNALQALEFAAIAADGQSERDRALYAEIQRIAAGVEIKLARNSVAQKRLRALAMRDLKAPHAPSTHLIAIKLAATSQSIEYESLLREHLSSWPESESRDLVLWWLGRFQEHADRFPDAALTYQKISPEFSKFPIALHSEQVCWRSITNPDDFLVEATSATDRFLKISQTESVLDANEQGQSALAALRVAHHFGLSGDSSAKALQQLLSPSATSDWCVDGRLALLCEYVRTRKSEDVSRILKQLETTSPEKWLDVFALTDRLSPLPLSEKEARLRLRVLDHAQRYVSDLSDSQRATWELYRCRSLAASGQVDQAAQACRSLLEGGSRNRVVAELYAQLMSSMRSPEDAKEAVSAWRNVVAHSRPESQKWYAARFQLIVAVARTGETQRASEMVRMIEALHPEVREGEMGEQLLDVKRKLERLNRTGD